MMELYFKKAGEGKPLIILHGLFGMGDNWASLSRSYVAEGFCVYLVDLRNHGRSPHSEEFSYDLMAADLQEFIVKNGLKNADLIGHSMGGKVAMIFAAKYSGLIDKLIIVDIGTKYYAPHHQSVLAAIHAVQPETLSSRKEAEERLREGLKEEDTIQFLLKNLYWNDDEKLDWRFNVKAIEGNIEEIGKAMEPGMKVDTKTLFVSGARSGYILTEDQKEIKEHFSDVDFVSIPDAGHWVHAENPKDFFDETLRFLRK